MVLPNEGSTREKTKRTTLRRNKNTKKGSTSVKNSTNQENSQVEPRKPDHESNNSKPKPSENPEQHVKPSNETSIEITPDKPQNEHYAKKGFRQLLFWL
jgi:hypothetical protein